MAPAPDLPADDLLQRIVGHVLDAGAHGALPWVGWSYGLSEAEEAEVARRWPSVALYCRDDANRPAEASPATAEALFAPLHALLLENRANDEPWLTALSTVLAAACFGRHHLWQDLGVADRTQVSAMLRQFFPPIFHGNVRNLRWKRHLFLMLGDRLGRADLRPPKCDGCDDFDVCFGPGSAPPPPTWPLRPLA